ncbi:MAG: EAL domain-containing protein [Myxococcales bacterium]|nr:EAL domain-containing protein [Myxococcales bacterium]
MPPECGEVVRTLLDRVPVGMCRFELAPSLVLDRLLPAEQAEREWVARLRADARLSECNRELCAILESSESELVGTRLEERFLYGLTNLDEVLRTFLRGGCQLSNANLRRVDSHGNVRALMCNLTGVLEDGRLVRLWGNLRDVTELRRVEDDNLRLAVLARDNPFPVLQVDAAGFVVTRNTAAERLLSELSVDLTDILPPNHLDLVRSCLESALPIHEAECLVRERVLVWTYIPQLELGQVNLYGSDVTERKRNEERLQHEALYDSLTALPNRALLADRLERALHRSQRHPEAQFAVLFLDLDRFKNVNDSLGHDTGDELLRGVARRLLECARRQDTVGRLGGDEFLILQEDLRGVGDATRLAERLLHSLAEPLVIRGRPIYTSASIGIALSGAGYIRAEDLLRNADTAMYRAKAAGRGRFAVFDSGMHQRALLLQRLETDLRRGVERREFEAHFQPIVESRHFRPVAFEALARWKHPERGFVSPGEFIPVAEETGLIEPISRQILEQACREAMRWQRPGAPVLAVSCNLSPAQFSDAHLVQHVRRVLEENRLSPGCLEIEITETLAARNPEMAVRVLSDLRQLGVRVLIDDFGTGYSSLGSLQRFPADVLKIDQGFVRRLESDPSAAAIINAVVNLAHALGFEVVAEGVETEAQLAVVRERGCDYLQGFYFGRPMPAAEVLTWLEKKAQNKA